MIKPNKLANNNFLSSLDMSYEEILHTLELAKSFKNKGLSSSPCIGAVHLVANYLNLKFPKKKIIAIFPETGERYAKTMYDLDWLKKNKLLIRKINKPIKKKSIEHDLKKFSYFNWNNRPFIKK